MMSLYYTRFLSARCQGLAFRLASRPAIRNVRLPQRRFNSTQPPHKTTPSTPSSTAEAGTKAASPPPATSPSSPSIVRALAARLAAPLYAYRRAAQTRPYIVQVSTSLTIWLAGDLLSQSIERSNDNNPRPADAPPTSSSSWDAARTARALAIGGAAAIPAYHWYNWVSGLFTTLPRAGAVAARVGLQMAVFAPVFNAYFFAAQALLSGRSLAQARARVAAATPTAWLNGVKVWPAVMAVNFAFVPPELRSLLPGFVAVGWQCYLCILNQRTARRLALENGEALERQASAPTAMEA
jgi:protein Mpv17